MIPLKTKSYAVTDVGAVREVNEDRYLAADDRGIWAVADGMGGMAQGDWAAAAIIAALEAVETRDDLAATLARTTEAVRQANRDILARAEQQQPMGSTVVLLVVRGRDFGVAWVGDSRGYLLRGRKLYRLTRDHSQVQELVDRGLLDAGAVGTHPMRNVLTRAVGVAAEPGVESLVDTVHPDDLILLCSDGLHGVVGEDEIEAALNTEPIESAAARLVRRCHELGAPDNVTLVLVSVAEITLARAG